MYIQGLSYKMPWYKYFMIYCILLNIQLWNMWNAKIRHSTKQPIKEINKAIEKPDTEHFIFKTEQKQFPQLSTVPHSLYEGMGVCLVFKAVTQMSSQVRDLL